MSDVFQALAHPIRREILALLREKALSAGAIAAHFDIAKPTLSGHLAVLKSADLIQVERRGTRLIYRINLSVAEEALSGLMDMLGIGSAASARAGKPKEVPE